MSEFDPSDDLRQPAEDRHAVDLDENRLDDLQSLADSLQTLPVLEDDIYLRLQAFNLGLVDSLLREWERGLLAEYHEKEHTPIPTMTIVGAVGQLWVFGLYELLRTWRQRVREVLAFAEELATLDQQARERRLEEKRAEVHEASADPARPNPAHWNGFERVANDRAFLDRLQDTLDRSEWPFRKLEALRVHLAKHEVPKAKGSYAMSPGYTRIDEVSQSICWEVSLGDMEVEILSRREIADMCSRFGTDKTVVILPKPCLNRFKRRWNALPCTVTASRGSCSSSPAVPNTRPSWPGIGRFSRWSACRLSRSSPVRWSQYVPRHGCRLRHLGRMSRHRTLRGKLIFCGR